MRGVNLMKKIMLLLVLLCCSLTHAGEGVNDCKKSTLIEILDCLSTQFEIANEELNMNLEAIKKERSNDELFIIGFNKAHESWKESYLSDCDSIYNLWRYGSVKNIKFLECKIELVKQRSAFLNKNYGQEAKDA